MPAIEREYERYQLVNLQINQLDLMRVEAVRTSTAPAVEQVRQLLRLKGIGMNSAWVYVMEFFCLARLSQPAGIGQPGWADPHSLSER